MPLNESVRSLKGVGEKRAALYEKLGIRTLWDLLEHYPRGYEDWSNPTLREKTPQLRGTMNFQSAGRAPQTKQSKQDEKEEKYAAG